METDPTRIRPVKVSCKDPTGSRSCLRYADPEVRGKENQGSVDTESPLAEDVDGLSCQSG